MKLESTRYVVCPKCKAPVAWVPESRFRPFCSARCKGLDLGAWASEQYRVEAADAGEDDDSPDSVPDEH